MKAWIVISPTKPPTDWGFQRDRWNKRYFRITTSRIHAQQIYQDLLNLEIRNAKKPKPFNLFNLST